MIANPFRRHFRPLHSRPTTGTSLARVALHLLFFCSGASGLIYEVVWVREFGNAFGNTVHSASLVIAVFMCGLGFGSYFVGTWADRQSRAAPAALVRAYGWFELAIGGMGLGISLLLPHLGPFAAAISSYSRDANGWYVPSVASHLGLYAIAVLLLTPTTFLMGGTLTLLIRYSVQGRIGTAGWTIALLYGVNTAGAAAGAFLTDHALIPAVGLRATQMVAVLLNLLIGVGALRLASQLALALGVGAGTARTPGPVVSPATHPLAVPLTGVALFLSGLAAMGMEILWFRHVSLLLSDLRTVFSLLLTVVLVGIWVGAVAGGFLHRRFGRAAVLFVAAQALFSLSALAGLGATDVRAIRSVEAAAWSALGGTSVSPHPVADLWFNLQPILAEVAIPAVLMGFAFPLGNAVIQCAESTIGRRAGALYVANTLGAVAGTLGAGFLLLPGLGMQQTALVLAAAAVLAAVPLWVAARGLATPEEPDRFSTAVLVAALGLAGAALGIWASLPSDYLISRSWKLPPGQQKVIAVSEGLTEVVAITEDALGDRRLVTNGNSVSSTHLHSQRYMRAFAHVPLLQMEEPETALIICFGVGNTAHAASLHPTLRRLEVVDISRGVLEHADYFVEVNRGVLRDPRVSVYVNDGRHHLRLRGPGVYDLITLEPPPVGFAGVSALYSRDFYALARTRLRPGGYLTQWLPEHEVPGETILSMVRAFVDVFPTSVLLSGTGKDLILMGVNGSRIEIDPVRVAARLARAPAVERDLSRVSLGRLTELVGTFVAASEALTRATEHVPPVTDDRPLQEYAIWSRLAWRPTPPHAIFAVQGVAAWCPACFAGGRPVPLIDGLDTYLEILDGVYRGTLSPHSALIRGPKARWLLEGSPYLRSLVQSALERGRGPRSGRSSTP